MEGVHDEALHVVIVLESSSHQSLADFIVHADAEDDEPPHVVRFQKMEQS